MEELARDLRKSSTDAEFLLWNSLRNRNLSRFKFRRQHPIPPYIVDFVCLEQHLVVELDGGQHVENARGDEARTAFLRSKGFRVIRFWNEEVLKETSDVLEEILHSLIPLTPALSPQAGRGSRLARHPGFFPEKGVMA